MKQLFDYGEVITTKSVNYYIEKKKGFHEEISKCLQRHISGDFGKLCKQDIEANLQDIQNDEGRILSRYSTSEGDIYINTQTEAYDFQNEKPIFKKITTILFCDEY